MYFTYFVYLSNNKLNPFLLGCNKKTPLFFIAYVRTK